MLRQGSFALFLAVIGAALMPCAQAPAQSPATAPRVVATTPTLEARFVPPDLAQLEVRFDRPMARSSWSWCGGGSLYPEITGPPRYVDDYTAVVPVRLEPGHSYQLGINCSSALGFRSAEGVSAEPTRWRFTTTWASPLEAQADRQNRPAWRELRRLFDVHYSYRDRTGTDWDSVFDEATPWILDAPDAEEWRLRVGWLLESAQDPHLRLRRESDGESWNFRTNRRPGNITPEGVRVVLPDLVEHAPRLWSARLPDGVAYLAIHSWSLTEEEERTLHEVLDTMTDARAVVLDMRGNGGGIETQGRAVAERFVHQSTVYATHRTRHPDFEGGWSPLRERRVHPTNDVARQIRGRLVVLQGAICLSSNESFLKMLREGVPGAVFVGERTGGSSANPRSYPLGNGYTVVLPSWEERFADGRLFEGVGLEPDVEVRGDVRTDDVVLRAGLRLARGEAGATSSPEASAPPEQ